MGILDGKAAVVTGGGRGIGRGHCLHLAANGASVVVNDIDQGEAAKVADEITKEGGRASTSTADISSREGAAALIEQCVDDFGGMFQPGGQRIRESCRVRGGGRRLSRRSRVVRYGARRRPHAAADLQQAADRCARARPVR